MPPITDTPYPLNMLRLYWNQSYLTNKHTICGHHVTPYILVIKNFMTPLFLFKNLWPPVYLGPPHSKENSWKMIAPSGSSAEREWYDRKKSYRNWGGGGWCKKGPRGPWKVLKGALRKLPQIFVGNCMDDFLYGIDPWGLTHRFHVERSLKI